MQISHNPNLSFQESQYKVENAIENGANTCPHALKKVHELVDLMKDIKQETNEPINIIMVGKKAKEKAMESIPESLSESAKKAVETVAEFVTAPYKACSAKCEKSGLTNGEVLSNIFAIWDKKSNVNVGNPFNIELTNERKLSKEEILEKIKKSDDPYAAMRETIGIKTPTSFAQANKSIANSLRELGIDPNEVNTKIAKAAK